MKLINNRIDEHPFPFVVMSYDDFFNTKPYFTERWQTKEDALFCAKQRQEEGFIVNVYKEIAHSENRD